MNLFKGTSGRTIRHWPPLSMPLSTATPLDALRKLLDKNGVGYYIVMTQDEHDSEYVAKVDRRREFISGFTGSAGVAIIGKDFAELSTDGRYFVQAGKELSSDWTLRKEGTPGTDPWWKALSARARKSGQAIGVDPRLVTYSVVKNIKDQLEGSSVTIKPVEKNLVDAVWEGQPDQPTSPVFNLSTKTTGESVEDKLARVRKSLKEKNAKALLVAALDEIAWLFNLRGSDIEFNPVFKSYAVITDTDTRLYVEESKLTPEAKASLPNVQIKKYGDIFNDVTQVLAALEKSKEAGASEVAEQRLWVPAGASWALVEAAGGAGNLITDLSPIQSFKANKNETEIAGARLAQVKCGLSLVRYLAWLSRELKKGNNTITEYKGAQKLSEIRSHLDEFRGESFNTISGVGGNAAIIHYAPAEDGKTVISDKEIYLLDSGCQFTHGTTDTTRTVHFGQPTDEEKRAYTLVLKGHIALANVVFPEGTLGVQIDVLARQNLWKQGLDYLHGTGHGVGSFLNVHEGPMGIAMRPGRPVPLQIGNLISNEPGYYETGKFGIRIESLVVVKEASVSKKAGDRKFLDFETVTLVPLAVNLIDVSLLDEQEREWVNKYNASVREALSSDLSEEDREWLNDNTVAI